MIQIFLIILGLIWIVFAVVSDLKTSEIPDWLNISLVVFALAGRLFYGLFISSDPSGINNFSWFYQGLIGAGIFFVLGNLLYLGRMFAGGDAKLMMALGAILPLTPSFFNNLNIFLLFFILFFFAGAVYGIFSLFVVALRNRKKFPKKFRVVFKKHKNKVLGMGFFSLFLMAIGFSEISFFYFGLFVFITPYLYLTAIVIEKYFMIKKKQPKELQEGDWLYKEVKLSKNKKIKPSWGGLTKKDIKNLKKQNKKVWIRNGIPFSPVFLIAFIVLIYLIKSGFSF